MFPLLHVQAYTSLKSNQIIFSVRFFAKQKTFAHHIFSQFQNNLHNFSNSQISYSFITPKFSDTAFLLLINSNASLILYSNTALCNIFPALLVYSFSITLHTSYGSRRQNECHLIITLFVQLMISPLFLANLSLHSRRSLGVNFVQSVTSPIILKGFFER